MKLELEKDFHFLTATVYYIYIIYYIHNIFNKMSRENLSMRSIKF